MKNSHKKSKSRLYPSLRGIVLCALFVCLTLGITGCGATSGTPQGTPIILEYPEFSEDKLSTVQRGELSLQYSFMCFIGRNLFQKEGVYLLRDIPDAEGAAVTYFFSEGDTVKKGDLIMSITFPSDERELDSLRTSITRTQAQLNSAPQHQKTSLRAALERLGARYELLLEQARAGSIYATYSGRVSFPHTAQGLEDMLLTLPQGGCYTSPVANIYLNPDVIAVTDLSYDPSTDLSRLYGVTGDNFELFSPDGLYDMVVYVDSEPQSYKVRVLSNPMYGYAADKILGKYTPRGEYNPANNVIFTPDGDLPQELIGKECIILVDIKNSPDCLYVPTSALIEEKSSDNAEPLYFVEKVVGKSKTQRIPVVPGIYSNNYVEIKPLAPISQGDRVTLGHNN